MLKQCVSTYSDQDKYYKLSVVEIDKIAPNLEYWWDAYEDRIDFIKGRGVTAYAKGDPNIDLQTLYIASDKYIMYENAGFNFNESPIPVQWRTRNIVFSKGRNVRIVNFYPQVQATG